MKPIYSTHDGKFGNAAQSHAWGAFGGASGEEEPLNDEEWRAWDEAAKQEKRRRHWPAGRRFTWQNLRTEINSHQRFLGLPLFRYPPEHPAFGLDRLGPLMAGESGGRVALKLGVPKVPAGYTLVFGSPPCPANRRACRDFRFLGLLPAPEGGASNIAELYRKKFGNPPPGSRVFIRTWQQVDGWRPPFPAQFSVVIPGKPHLAARRRRPRATGMA
jgi:hypothetical protein